MSGAAMIWARQQKVGAPHLHALLNALAARVGNDGSTYVSQATIARDLGLKDRQVRQSLAVLTRLGVITREQRNAGNKGRLSDRITLALDKTFDVCRGDLRKVTRPVVTGSAVPVAAKSVTGSVVPHPPAVECQGKLQEIYKHPSQEEELTFQEEAPRTREAGLGRPVLRVVAGGLASSGWGSSIGDAEQIEVRA
ncbi:MULTISPECIES: helix-turn-helix domain-containing protein [unclassified Chelatococcus]|uniref:helix-turn-helix domain-containing protein n=1 Tax=unclassified Chelatococcus TaxID=2638111 RepID=UPI001BCFACBF|nr:MULTISPECIES: helix-turn-helix domain-containing protein [unclassified Chelatococcus]MBS7741461.1 hypothetical protein [Chelatococcus sp. HY11]MBX3544519.1 hypothetical protein [Chelatococcus sp.]MCO5078958.1 helix-turn-helix domain-containing protein [Chelatococcus sp.]